MTVTRTRIEGLLLVESDQHDDARGFFRESYRLDELAAELGREPRFRQGNHSRSAPGVLRGFHAEPWDKLVYVVRGLALCAVVDPRPGSLTFAESETFLLGDPPGRRVRLFVGQGLANAFQAVEETDYVNEVSEAFDLSRRGGFAWDDPAIGIEWPILPPILSHADLSLPPLGAGLTRLGGVAN
jgi:dTDP-4-dehydrorhamnose 3,5-epimerase